jgi:SH3-like domain-containing protein
MKQFIRLGMVMLFLAVVPTLAAKEKMMSIQVRQGQLRSAPSYLSRVVSTLNYTDRVTVLEDKGAWLRVRPEAGGAEGWMHEASLTKKRLKLAAGAEDATTTVSSEEQALAGKGFNSDVESKFKERNADIDFSWVDKMEKIKIPAKEITKFLESGDVKPTEGGAK